MKYDFTSIIDRRGWDSIAASWPDGKNPSSPYVVNNIKIKDGFDFIPMWVADMNFKTVPTIPEALIKRAEHPLYGYFQPRDEYFELIKKWQKVRNGVDGIEKENIGYENGVLGGVATALSVLCSKGDKILLHSPTYVGFTGVIKNNGYDPIHSPLVEDENGILRMDYEDMDKKLREQHIHTAIFCSPHNPSGRVWERWEIEKAMEVYAKNDCWVISDEIWSDILMNGHKHIPTQSVSEDARQRVVAFYAPSKTFNLAGLIGSYHIVYNKWLNDRMAKEASLGHYNSMNVLSMHALIGAYQPEGYEWCDELNQVLSDNVNYAYDFICKNFKGVTLKKPEGTYLLYLDCSEWLKEHGMTLQELLNLGYEYGVGWQDGSKFLIPDTIRMNLALPTSRVKEAFDRLDKYVFNK